MNVQSKLSIDYVHASSSVNVFENRIDNYLIKAGYTFSSRGGCSISQWLPCALQCKVPFGL